ncbi:hypothetical protein GCM10011409_42290 [Lentibacillus populi]|uniref:Tetrapyrrole biosynthesis uroporphyrinogen III synthase domain-containing protein n=1 Tax=Lentibacillus populi TaxID=1827502 RepID=A0A9W5X7K3_9BACI|nr:uroporphyrinogen-III synthase [Lentibacillus populi]GGB60463.1 hypothetical protein GCM10011409_42290 [Lentibacillus populi]
MSGLEGKQIGIAASRKANIIAKMIQQCGGTPYYFPIQGEQVLNNETSIQNVKELLMTPFDVALLTTGVGMETLEEAALHLNEHERFIQKLANTKLVVRGSKTVKWLKKHSLTATYVSPDGTMNGLLTVLPTDQDLDDRKRLFLQAYNQDDVELKVQLEAYGYSVYLAKPYQYKQPDVNTVHLLWQWINERSLDSVIFTSKTQVQNLFQAKQNIDAVFPEDVLAVAVGNVTAQELANHHVSRIFYPGKPKMGTMMVELERYFARNETKDADK